MAMVVGGGGDGSDNDDESIRSHDSDKYSGASGGEHSSGDDRMKAHIILQNVVLCGRILMMDCMRVTVALMRPMKMMNIKLVKGSLQQGRVH